MAANNRDFNVTRLLAFQFRNKGVGADDVQRGHAKQFVLIVYACFFQHFCSDSNGRVHRVGDNTDTCFRAGFSNLLHQVLHDTGVNVEQVGTIHTRFTCNTRRDQYHISTFQCRGSVFAAEAFDFHSSRDMAQINGHARRYWSDVVQGEF